MISNLHRQEWYYHANETEPQDERIVGQDNTTVFIISAFQYLTLAFVFRDIVDFLIFFIVYLLSSENYDIWE